ncbi:response regulator [Arenibacter latericius]|uniref:response regulator n=1 Tax=Arenibacter latericius TaxID=86104 RepID=UPI0003F53D26|nr:response regulator [Arenibacter latericius]
MRKSIMIIDDNLVSQYATRYAIQQSQVKSDIFVCDSAQEALDVLNNFYQIGQEFPDYIFIDLNKPEMNGWTFLDQFYSISDKAKDTKVYFLSSFVSTIERDKANHYATVKGFCNKPLSASTVDLIFE